MANQIKMFQGFVVESGYRAKQYKPSDYFKTTEKLHQDNNLTLDMVFMFYKHIINDEKNARKVITDEIILDNITAMIENDFITPDGKFTEHAKTVLAQEGFYVDANDVVQAKREEE